jgi:phosphoglycerate dehydrogenase-like enzyme
MDPLIAATAADRLDEALKDCDAPPRLLRGDPTGDGSAAGRAAPAAAIRPEAAWSSLDGFDQGLWPRFVQLVERSPTVRWLQTVHAGVDSPFYGDLLARKVRLCNSHVHAPAIAEYVLAQVLAIFQNHERWRECQRARQWQPSRFREIAGTRWLVVGAGHVGTEIARRATAFGASVTGVRRSAVSHPEFPVIVQPAGMDAHLAVADVVVLACPLDDQTRGLANERFFAAMMQGAVFVNVARGGLVDEGALLAALERDKPGCAVLDVTGVEPLPTESPLWTNSRVRLTAHSAFAGSGTQGRSDRLFLENLRRYCAGEPLLEEVRAI